MNDEERAEEIEQWGGGFRELHKRLGGHFVRSEPRERAMAYVKGLLSEIPRKNGWQLAEQAGELTPDGMQRLLSTAQWDAEAVRDEVRGYGVEWLGDETATLVVDETGFLKKGTKSVGVKCQYSGTAGRVENCQIGVFGAYASPHGYSLIDRAGYLPKEWAQDGARRREAKVPDGVDFATKPQLAQGQLARAFAAGVPCRWVTGESIYGGDRALRVWLEGQQRWFVLEINQDEPLWHEFVQVRADTLAAQIPDYAWQRLSCGKGSKGERLYDWALVALPRWQQSPDVLHALLVRRSLTDGELAYYVVFAPAQTRLDSLVQVAGQRWTVEECFELAKSEVGLDEYEVRHWPGWYRHITLSMFALAFLTATPTQAHQAESKKKDVRPPG
jgi:SRSO17 transposase